MNVWAVLNILLDVFYSLITGHFRDENFHAFNCTFGRLTIRRVSMSASWPATSQSLSSQCCCSETDSSSLLTGNFFGCHCYISVCLCWAAVRPYSMLFIMLLLILISFLLLVHNKPICYLPVHKNSFAGVMTYLRNCWKCLNYIFKNQDLWKYF